MYHTLRSPVGLALLVGVLATAVIFYLTNDEETMSILKGIHTPEMDLEREELEYESLQAATNPMKYARNVVEFLEGHMKDIEEGVYEKMVAESSDEDREELRESVNQSIQKYTRYHKILNNRRKKNDIVRRMSLEKDKDGKPLIDWSRYSYMTYATDPDYLCNALMLFDQLQNAHMTKATLSLIYPREWGSPTHDFERLAKEADNKNKKGRAKDQTMALLRSAQDKYGINLIPVKPMSISKKNMNRDELERDRRKRPDTWKHSFTKMLAFNQVDFDRIIMIDADAYMMDSLDYLFFEEDESIFGAEEAALNKDSKFWDISANETAPAVQGPPAYWLVPDTPGERAAVAQAHRYGVPEFSTMLEVITPSKENFRRVQDRFRVLEKHQLRKSDAEMKKIRQKFYDMELVNDVFANVSIVADHDIFEDPEVQAEIEDELWGMSNGASSKYSRPANSFGVLDHRGLIMLTGELSLSDHSKYLKNYVALRRDKQARLLDPEKASNQIDEHRESAALWDPSFAIATTAYIHFSDWPFPKPWIQATADEVLKSQPQCQPVPNTYETSGWLFRKKKPVMQCEGQKIWHMFFHDFANRRKDICSFPLRPY